MTIRRYHKTDEDSEYCTWPPLDIQLLATHHSMDGTYLFDPVLPHVTYHIPVRWATSKFDKVDLWTHEAAGTRRTRPLHLVLDKTAAVSTWSQVFQADCSKNKRTSWTWLGSHNAAVMQIWSVLLNLCSPSLESVLIMTCCMYNWVHSGHTQNYTIYLVLVLCTSCCLCSTQITM